MKRADVTPKGWLSSTATLKQAVIFILLRHVSLEVETLRVSSTSILIETQGAMSPSKSLLLLNIATSSMQEKDQESPLLDELKAMSCLNGNCVLWPPGEPKGMCTQGMCRCLQKKNHMEIHRAIQLIHQLHELRMRNRLTPGAQG
jgi:hypothetical protein